MSAPGRGGPEEPAVPEVYSLDGVDADRIAAVNAALQDHAGRFGAEQNLTEDPESPDSEDGRGEEDDAPDSLPLGTPSEYARRALNRERRRARDQGLHPTRKAPAARGTRAGLGGRERTPSAADPQKISGVLTRLMGETGWADGLAVGDVMNRWDEIVGDDIAEHCHPETFEHGVLVLRANSSSWAAGIRALGSTLVSRIEQEVGRSVVTEIKVLGPAQHSFKRGRWSVRGGRGPRDTWG